MTRRSKAEISFTQTGIRQRENVGSLPSHPIPCAQWKGEFISCSRDSCEGGNRGGGRNMRQRPVTGFRNRRDPPSHASPASDRRTKTNTHSSRFNYQIFGRLLIPLLLLLLLPLPPPFRPPTLYSPRPRESPPRAPLVTRGPSAALRLLRSEPIVDALTFPKYTVPSAFLLPICLLTCTPKFANLLPFSARITPVVL